MALKPRVGRVILDACAAPGMKTSLLAAITKNEGSIIAIERDSKRCETLRTMLEGLGVTNVTVVNKDFTDVIPHEHPEVEYILVDPSCSGSGINLYYSVYTL
jgi:putative methyltransferase